MPPIMRALVLENPGGPAALTVTEVPDPVPGPGQALVQVAACGFCHHDLLVMKGVLRRGVKPGVILGHEISGTVREVGAGVTAVSPGDRVVTLLTDSCGRCDRCLEGLEHRCRNGQGIGHGRDGGFAEYVAVSEFSLAPLPLGLDLATAALYACPMGVALQGLQTSGRVQPGETVVVTGAGGGLGVHAVQLGAALGARVLAVTSSPEKVSQLADLGAAEVVETGELDFSEIVLALTGEEGAQVIIDTVGSAIFPSTWRSLAQYGRWVMLGEVAGRAVELDPAEIIFRDARIVGSSGVSRALIRQVADIASQGLVKPIIGRTLPLEQVDIAFELLSSRSALGRVLLDPRLG
jgi:acryloyl-coenzyme A reductase